MFLRILLGVACLSLMTASESEAQLFRRRLAPRITQPQVQPRQYTPPTGYSQNGYQGRPSATPRPTAAQRQTTAQRSQPIYVRRPDGSVVLYYPANNTQVAANQAQKQVQVPRPPQTKISSTVGQLQAVNPQARVQRNVSSTYLSPTVKLTSPKTNFVAPRQAVAAPQQTVAVPQRAVAPVGISVINQQPVTETTVGSISPATPMPQASTIDPASSIPVTTAATNPAPSGLSLSQANNVVPASADVEVQTPSADPESGQKTFSVLETIE